MLTIHKRIMASGDDDSFIFVFNRHLPSSTEQIFPSFSQLHLPKQRGMTLSCNQTHAIFYGRRHINHLHAAKGLV